ncbi:saponin hydrolase precursor [Paraphaeosphaeria sporulosa]
MANQFVGAKHTWGPGQEMQSPYGGFPPLDTHAAQERSQAWLNIQFDNLRFPSYRGKGTTNAVWPWAYKWRFTAHTLKPIAAVILVAMVLSCFWPGNTHFPTALMFLTTIGAAVPGQISPPPNIPPPPAPEPIEVCELPLPPVAPSDDVGSCTLQVNPRGTGCILRVLDGFQAGDFTTDGNNVIVNVRFTGAPASPDPASIYTGDHLILVKADGTTFAHGDPWKCLSCGVPGSQQQLRDPQLDYPHVFRSGDKALWGHNILDCNGTQLADDECTAERTNIYPIYWATIKNGTDVNGAPRELRLHPDDTHLGWSSFTPSGGQNTFFGRLRFNPEPTSGDILAPRYELVDVNLLRDPNRSEHLTVEEGELKFHDDVIAVGELRGFSGTGDEIVYIGETYEANNVDVSAVHVVTGAVRRLTEHPEYTDPISFSADNKWIVALDTRGTNRQMFMSGLRHIPPLIDLVTVTVASSTRNNGNRRFFNPILIDGYGDRGDYFGQQINAEGDGGNGAVNDPNWNARADPAFSRDGTKMVYWQAIVTGRECGGTNPLPCPVPTTQGQRVYRLMLAKLTSRAPQEVPPVFDVPDQLPWATPFPPGTPLLNTTRGPGAGKYTLRGKISGLADVELSSSSQDQSGSFDSVAVTYRDYADVDGYVLNGWENVTSIILWPNPWNNLVDWYSDIEQTGVVTASKKTGSDGFHLQIDAMLNIFNATGTLTTTVDEVVYEQPANGT